MAMKIKTETTFEIFLLNILVGCDPIPFSLPFQLVAAKSEIFTPTITTQRLYSRLVLTSISGKNFSHFSQALNISEILIS